MNYSALKLRKLPIHQRLDVIMCFPETEIYKEIFNILVELHYDLNTNIDSIKYVLVVLFERMGGSLNTDEISKILQLKCVDLLFFIKEIFCVYMKANGGDRSVSHIHCILSENQGYKYIKEVSILLEDFYIANFNKTYYSYIGICYLLENTPIFNKLKLIDLLVKHDDTDFVMGYLKSCKQKYPEFSPLRQKIENILNIYDIIV